MKILVCFKTVPEFDQVVDADWERFALDTDLRYAKRCFGCFDETALETALLLKDALITQREDAVCCAVTLGSLPSSLCKTLFAVGFDHIQVLESSARTGEEFRPWETAAVLAQHISGGKWDLILAGRQAGYADTGMVPLILAEKLRLPVITEAEFLAPLGKKSLFVERSGMSCKERIGIRLPALVVMGNSPVSSLRPATLAAQLNAAMYKAETASVDGAIAGPACTSEAPRLIRKRAGRNGCILPGGNNLSQSAKVIARKLREWGFQ